MTKNYMLSSKTNNEVFFAMILCGEPADNFKIAYSKRYANQQKNTIKV